MDIIEESQLLEIAKRLVRRGKKVTVFDRAAIVHLVRGTYGRLFDYEICDATAGGVAPIPNTTMGNPLSSYTLNENSNLFSLRVRTLGVRLYMARYAK